MNDIGEMVCVIEHMDEIVVEQEDEDRHTKHTIN